MSITTETVAILLTLAFGFASIALAFFFGLRSFNAGIGVKIDRLVDELHRGNDNLSVKLDRVVENTAAVNAKIDTLIVVLPRQRNSD